MSTDINEYEQSERVKQWLKENGSGIVIGLLLAIGGVFGFREWQSYQAERSVQAARYHSIVQEQLDSGERKTARSALETLKQDYGDNLFTGLAALAIGGRAQDEGDLAAAGEQYRYVLENGSDESLRVIGGLRLARVQIARGEAEGALATLDEAPDIEAFRGYRERVRGDAFWALEQHDKAREAYTAARDALGGTPDPLLSLRLERLDAEAAPASPAEEGAPTGPGGDASTGSEASPAAEADTAGEAS